MRPPAIAIHAHAEQAPYDEGVVVLVGLTNAAVGRCCHEDGTIRKGGRVEAGAVLS